MTRDSRKSSTIHEIARRAGVSIASVSRALNGKPGIGEALRERILKISRELEYRPSAAARALISGKAAVVGISLGRQEIELRPYYILLYQHLTLALHQHGRVPMFFAHDQFETLSDQAGSAILLGESPDDTRARILTEKGIPWVRVGSAGEGFSLAPDDRYGIELATRYLIDKGRRRLVFLGSELELPYCRHRLAGYQQVMQDAGLAERSISLPFTIESALDAYRELARHLKRYGLDFDGLVCETDELALGAVAALEDHGIVVPDQVAVTGFDDLPALAGSLTTVRQDIALLAREAVALLVEALAGEPPRHMMIPVELVPRETG
jgi:LacI family transcriptional regulator|uniref:LacI family DNA-binding transcriptional regulator n=1 Tax=Halomonas sp. TaxID=1486246 RepID=UPI0026387736|nr:LacI family DNA-binding transcriptional regulator [Halomonas sp.]